jgi:hypothetical protein
LLWKVLLWGRVEVTRELSGQVGDGLGRSGLIGVVGLEFWNGGGGNKVRFSEGMVGDDGSAKVLQWTGVILRTPL